MTQPPELTLPALLHARSALGDKDLLVCDDERLGYGEALARSAELAARLVALGAGRGSHVGLLYPNGADFVVGLFAAARIGAVVVPFSTFSTAPELLGQLVDGDVSVLLAARSYRSHDYVQRLTEALGEALPEHGPIWSPAAPVLRHIVFTGDGPGPRAPDHAAVAALEADVDGCDVLAVIYTSGSTSAPKGVVHTHEALLGHQHNLNAIRRLGPDDRLFCNSPFFWIGGFAFGLLATVTAGATLICSSATDPARTLDLLEAEKPTVTNGFAGGIAHLARDPSFAGRDLSSMRRGNLYPIMAPDSRPADPELRHNMLGMTEAGSVVLLSGDESDQPESRRGSFGYPAPGFETRVVDPDSGADAAGGELLIRGRYLMQGYHGRPREDCFDADGWFHTGDLVRRDAEGLFYFLGRAGSMIKTAGANVAPAEVEKALTEVCAALGVEATVHVLGLPDPERGQLVAAVIATEGGEPIDAQRLRGELGARLSSYKIPRRFTTIRRAALPMRSSGKIDLPALQGLFDG
ncbi:MAG: class I adenylate-forming enzyme family protein [Actinomycetota bacterium]|nr:class I adenylate-forming enzyme family protein [Actinomycetota bacterium]